MAQQARVQAEQQARVQAERALGARFAFVATAVATQAVRQVLGPQLAHGDGTAVIFKSKHLEVVRMAVPKGKGLPTHKSFGDITL